MVIKLMVVCLALAVSCFGLSAFAQGSASFTNKCCSISPDGDVSPYTYYIYYVRTEVYKASSNSVQYSLNMRTTQDVSLGWINATVQRYENGTWVNAAPGRYYEARNKSLITFTDTVSNLPSGQYRVAVDYNVSHNGYTDYVYNVSENYAYL